MITKEQFEELADINLVEQDGKLIYDGDLDLKGRKYITELPENLKVLGSLYLCYSSLTKLPKGLEVEGTLDISETNIKELPKDTTFDSFYANYMKKPFSFPKVMKVNGYFDCKDTTIKRMPEELYVKFHCVLLYSTFDKLPKVMEVGYSLYLSNTPINELSESLIVGGTLYLTDANLKDYSHLYKVCSRFYIKEEKYEKIKDTLDKHDKEIIWHNEVLVTFEPNYKGAYLFEKENGKYIKADDIFAKIVEQKGNVYHIQRDGSKNITYLVTDGEGRWSHGYTLEGAKADLLYKITDRDKSDYEGLTLDSELSFDDAIVCYRVITGACSFGTRDFIENRLGENKKDKYTIKEIIDLTNGEYGNEEFKEFFCKS